jgi:membrane protein implicated in regulation of membrane protease activity
VRAPTDGKSYYRGDTVRVKARGGMARSGYTFEGWAASRRGKVKYKARETFKIIANTALWAVWTRNPGPPVDTNDQGRTYPPVSVDDDVDEYNDEGGDEENEEPLPAAPGEQNPSETPDEPEPPTGAEPEATVNAESEADIAPETTGFMPEDVVKFSRQTKNIFSDIANGTVPLGNILGRGAWSLLSLILSLIAVIIAIVLIVRALVKRRRKDDEDMTEEELHEEEADEKYRKRGKTLRMLAIITGVLTPIVWLIFDNLNQPMAWINRWTIIVAFVFIVHIAILIAYRVRKGRRDRADRTQ